MHDGMFKRMEYKGETYVDQYGYRKEQPIESRKMGFGSHDASKRSEFTLTRRTEQYREQLKAEKLLADKRCKEEMSNETSDGETKAAVPRPLTLYDRVTTGWAEPQQVGKKRALHPKEERVRGHDEER